MSRVVPMVPWQRTSRNWQSRRQPTMMRGGRWFYDEIGARWTLSMTPAILGRKTFQKKLFWKAKLKRSRWSQSRLVLICSDDPNPVHHRALAVAIHIFAKPVSRRSTQLPSYYVKLSESAFLTLFHNLHSCNLLLVPPIPLFFLMANVTAFIMSNR